MSTDQFALPAFIISIVGLVVAGIGMVTGVVSLVWQIVTRTRGAHRVVVEVNSRMMLAGGPPGTAGPYVQVVARNRGAAAVSIQSWSIKLDDGNGLFSIPALFPPSPTLPYQLDAGASVSFETLSRSLADAAAGRDLSKARAVVHLATGQSVQSRRGISA